MSVDKISDSFKNLIKTFGNSNGIGINIIDGLINGLKSGIIKVVNIIKELVSKIISTFCSLLGIHSPSTVFYEYGTNIIFGLIDGINNTFPKLKQIFKNIYETIKSLSFESIASIIWPLTSIIPQLKFLELPRQFLNLFKACGFNSLEGLKQGLQGTNGVFATIIDLARKVIDKFKSILQINSPSKVFIAIGGFIIAGLAIGLKDSFPQVTNTIKSLFDNLIEIIKKIDLGKILAVGLTTGLLYTINNLMKTLNNFAALANRVTAPLKGLGDALSGIGKMFSNKGEAAKIKAKGDVIRNIGLSIALIAGSIYMLGKLNKDELMRASAAVGVITIVVTAMYGLVSLTSKNFTGNSINNADKSINSLIKIAGSILLLAIAIKLISKIEINEQTITTFAILGTIIGGFSLLMKSSMLAGQYADKAGSMLLKISVALFIIVKVIKEISKLTIGELAKGIAVITAIEILFGALIIVSSVAGEFGKDTGKMITKISASILLILIAIKLISKLTIGEIVKGIAVITAIEILFGALIIVSSVAGEFGNNAGSMILKASAGILLIVAAMKIISSMKIGEIVKGIAVVTAIEVLFGVLIGITHFAGENATKAGLMLLEISGALLIVVGALYILSKIDDKDLWRSVGIIAILEGLFGGLIFVSKFAKDVKGTIITITVCITLLIAAIVGLTFLDQDKLKNATLCVSLLIAVFTAFVGISKFAGGFVKVIGILAALELAMLGLVGILYIMEKADLKSGIQNAESLSLLLLSMSAVLGVLTLIGLGGPAALIGIGSLIALVGALALLLPQLGKISDDTKALINRGGSVLSDLGYIISNFVGSLISGFSDAIVGSLPKIAESLSKFMNNLSGFINGVNNINGPTLEGIKNLAEAIILITGAELIAGISKFLNLGGSSLSDFGSQLENLGKGLNSFINSISDINPENKSKIETACEAIKLLAEANKSVPNTGGLLSNIIGDNSLSDFGSQLEDLGKGLNSFVTSLTTFNTDSVGLVKAACESIKSIAEANNSIPNTGGLLSKIIGDNNLSDFGSQLENLGKGLNSFVTSLTDFSPDSMPLVNAACNAIKSIANLGSSIGDSDWFSKLIGKSDLTKFSEEIPNLGVGINGFITALGNFSAEKLSVVNAACEAIQTIAGLGYIDLASLSTNLSSFGTNLIMLGSSISVFISDLSQTGLDVIAESITKVQELINMATNIASVSIESLSMFSNSLIQVGTEGVNGFCEAFSGFEPVEKARQAIIIMLEAVLKEAENHKDKFKKAFEELMKASIEGAKSKKDEMVNTFRDICQAVIDHVNSRRPEMVTTGEYFADGFAEGIRNHASNAINAAIDMAVSSLNAARQALDMHSPSKETMKLGNFFGEGFVIGIKDYFSKVYDTAFDSGELAKSGLNDAITRIQNIIDDNIDAQPRITPILDLSNIKDDINNLNGILSTNSIGVNRNLNAISNLNLENQNRGNSTLSAIEKLASDLRMNGGNTWNIYTQELDSDKLRQIVDYVANEFGKVYN